jgi:hypothetical protein
MAKKKGRVERKGGKERKKDKEESKRWPFFFIYLF